MWVKIICIINQLHDSCIILNNTIQKVIGDGASTLFWKDQWIGENTLMVRFSRLFIMETDKDCMISQRWNGATFILA